MELLKFQMKLFEIQLAELRKKVEILMDLHNPHTAIEEPYNPTPEELEQAHKLFEKE